MASAKIATKAAADDRTDIVIPPSMCAASLSSLISLSSGRVWCDRMVAAVNPRSQEPFNRPIRTQAYCPLREDKVATHHDQQSTRVRAPDAAYEPLPFVRT